MENRSEDELVFKQGLGVFKERQIYDESIEYRGYILYTIYFSSFGNLFSVQCKLETLEFRCHLSNIESSREHIKNHFMKNRKIIDKILSGMNIYGE